MPIKTNEEMLAILKVLNGSNSIDLVQPFSSRIPDDRDWSFKALQLFKSWCFFLNRIAANCNHTKIKNFFSLLLSK